MILGIIFLISVVEKTLTIVNKVSANKLKYLKINNNNKLKTIVPINIFFLNLSFISSLSNHIAA